MDHACGLRLRITLADHARGLRSRITLEDYSAEKLGRLAY